MINRVEIIFIPEQGQLFQQMVSFYPGMTVEDALNQTTLYSDYPESKSYPVGIYSKPVELTTRLSNGDRIEIYRSLVCSPKERRKQKALAAKNFD